MTTYSEVGPDDTEVAAFLASQLHILNIWRLPLKAFVAKQDGKPIAVMAITCVQYPAIHLLVVDPATRPFMRITKLWYLARDWMRSINMPMICAPVFAHLHHFQFLVRKLGFEKIGEEMDENGNTVENIYAYYFKEKPHEDPLHSAE